MKTVRLGLSISAALMLSSCALAPAGGLKESLTVYDAKNREIGKVIGFIFVQEAPKASNFAPVVIYQTGNSWFPFAVFRNRLVQLTVVGDVQPMVFFDATNCAGAPYVQIFSEANSLIPRAELIIDQLYLQDLKAGVRKIPVRSLLASDGKEKECAEGGGDLEMAPATLVDFQFTPPFIIR